MKIALVCPSNMLYMPYVNNYKQILDKMNAEYDIINWDRFKIEKESKFVYRDSKIGHQRNFLDYFKYSKFVLNMLKENKYDKIVVFGIQLVFFLKRQLIQKYNNRYIIDIRDHNKIIKYFNIEKAIEASNFTVLSSSGYKEWLPKSNKYIINHNTKIESLDELSQCEICKNVEAKTYTVGCIGALRDYIVNIDFIESLKNSRIAQLNYHGEGDINKDISQYLLKNNIKNVNLTGRYIKTEEKDLYNKNNIINVLRYNDGLNNKTALPNRLYNAALYGKPMLAFEGTYLSDVIKAYKLGLVINSFDKVEEELIKYINEFDTEFYEKNRKRFLEMVVQENREFGRRLEKFAK